MNHEYFKISSGLKTLIGSELITDNFVAVFELVKNSFDADATEVTIVFENLYRDNTRIIIRDNGKGMDYDDLINKWLFVAYSAKRDGTEDYRDNLKNERLYAGAKGVGRFSCDRLGRYLNLISIKNEVNSKIENLKVDWAKFEEDQNKEFITIPVEHNILDSTSYDLTQGTVLEISGINPNDWNRENLKRLKDKLSKLVRPDLNKSLNDKKFKIILEVPEEKENDRLEIEKGKKKEESEGYFYYNTVNGEIRNFIFDELNIRTTKIISLVSPDGKTLTTTLIDRDIFIYEIIEKNRFNLISNSTITLYFLNTSAKSIFTKKMGIRNVDYGSIFVYKNGFRVYPYGERGDDSLGVDNRAVQGYSRYISLRNLIGQIDIQGQNSDLREATSRDAGLVKSKSYYQLVDLSPFADSLLLTTLKRLEKFVVEVTEWGINNDSFKVENSEHAKRELIKVISNAYDEKALISLDYNKEIIDLLDQKEGKSAKKLVTNFKRLASETNDSQLLKDAQVLEKRFIQQSQAIESAQKELHKKELIGKELKEELEQQISETLFARADRITEKDDLLSIQHHIYRHSALHINKYIDDLVIAINKDKSNEELLKLVSKISFENKKVVTLSRFVTKAQFDTTVTKIEADLVKFINEYVSNVYQEYTHLMMNNQHILITTEYPADLDFITSFRPIEIIIVLDNLLSNSFKAKAKKVKLIWKKNSEKEIELHIIDDGIGVPEQNIQKVFTPRFTTTDGSGLGLYHTREVIEKMKGEISVKNNVKGTEFIIKFRNEVTL